MAMQTRFTKLLGCGVPLQVAPMGTVGTPELLAAAASAGAHVMTSTAGLPPAAVEATIARLVETVGRGFGVNFLVPILDRDALAVAARSAPLVDFYLGPPDGALVDVVHAGGALCGWQVTSGADAVAAREAGCDLIVAHGVEAGGRNPGGIGLVPLLQEVLDAVVDLPVVAAGGIATARGVAAALVAGADAARLGTRFIATVESGGHPRYVEAIVAARGEDAVISDAYVTGW